MTTNIRVGTLTPTAFYVGAEAVSEIYLGDKLVYSQVMPKIRSYGTVTPYNSDFIVGTDRETTNVTRNYKVSKIVDIILASLGIGTVTSIATRS